MLVELSMGDLIGLLKLSSLGKLIGGLVHNLNGPLQNLGIDIELMRSYVMEGGHLSDDAAGRIGPRLRRMEEEYERINELILATVRKADIEEDYQQGIDVNELLQQELSHLTANLYFKHHVTHETRFQEDLPQLMNLSEYSRIAIGGFCRPISKNWKSKRLPICS